MASGIHKPMKSSPQAKDLTASKLINSDMPLYIACPCKNSRPFPAQLTRIHFVTPKAPMHVTVSPQVQPDPPNGPIFHCGWTQPKKLPHNSCWVLRLPYVYWSKYAHVQGGP